ncbi:uncharacterized protein KY384_004796 [Bacidia gigantensis]|uniref:uncharacterized protein n=1 Tax=Bacidia gigantensis TaxID=2732470 RepID=UPI001D0389FB|nr:uncharacterized protein KY384_004796 [Bacidia gigantensis]KAG8530294.1 hypothetical protein KY384_004796 [Bacidia gigantensis]
MSLSEPLLGETSDAENQDTPQWKESKRRRQHLPRRIDDVGSTSRWKGYRLFLMLGTGALLLLGFVQLVSILIGLVSLVLPTGVDKIVRDWGRPGHLGAGLVHYPTDFSRDILPKACHSHNDYWRDVPLFSAIRSGCIGVEADIWRFDKDLYVGHSITSLTPNRTLASLYINPLLDILEKQNPTPQIMPDSDKSLHGVFDTDQAQTLILLIDFKTYGPSTWPAMYSALDPLRTKGYLTHVANNTIIQRPITVVGTGNTPFDKVVSLDANPHQDVFFDAPLEQMYLGPKNETAPPSLPNTPSDSDLRPRSAEEPVEQSGQGQNDTPSSSDAYNELNSYYASVSFNKVIGHLDRGEFSEAQLDLVRGYINGAQARGLKARYWDTPFWPIGLRNHVWDTLMKEGADFLNVDDLVGATQSDWGKWKGWWRRGKRTGSWKGH